VNVLYHDGDQIVPIRTSLFVDARKHEVMLCMITDGNEKFITYQYKACLD